MCFPKVQWVPWIEGDDKYHYFSGAYYPNLNIIELSARDRKNMFWTLVHEMGHWTISRLPYCDITVMLNLIYDWVCYDR